MVSYFYNLIRGVYVLHIEKCLFMPVDKLKYPKNKNKIHTKLTLTSMNAMQL